MFPLTVLVLPLLAAILFGPLHNNPPFLHEKSSHQSSRILLLSAHPDDEAAFFAPTLLALRAQNPAPDVYSLCLSTGDADGLGERRVTEYKKSHDVLGTAADRRWVLDNPALKDNLTASWDADIIANVIRPYVVNNQITTILTFDKEGISYHPNHISLPFGVLHLLAYSPPLPIPNPRLYTLITRLAIPKYTSFLAPLLAKFNHEFLSVLQQTPAYIPYTSDDIHIVISGMYGYQVALKAFLQYKSQMVWFRWLYIAFSRYMWVNEWVEVTVESISYMFR